MSKRLFHLSLLTLALWLAGSVSADTSRHETTWQGAKRTYLVHLPTGADAQPLPLIVLLHGSGRRGKIMIDEWRGLADEQKLILLAPDSLNSESWSGPSDGPGFLVKTVDEVRKAYPVDERRIYLFGHSAGGHFGLIIGLMQSSYFAAVATHAGAISVDAEAFAGLKGRKIPIALWAGDRDRAVPIEDVRRTAELLERNEFPVQISVLPRHDHNYYAVSRKVNAEVWSFFSGHSLEAEPRYVDYGDHDVPAR